MIRMLVRRLAQSLGYEVVASRGYYDRYPDLTEQDWESLAAITNCTMTSVARQVALVDAARHVTANGIPGCFVECGVWRGGSSMLAALTLRASGDETRQLHLYDTFAGMPPPMLIDVTRDGLQAAEMMARDTRPNGVRCVAGIDDVFRNLAATGYPMSRVCLVPGLVEDTLPVRAPAEPIALLRLDTDWYQSTRHELEHLYPLVAPGGLVIIDDYGHRTGARRAVDDYLALLPRRPFLHRIDDTGRLLIKS